MIGSINVPVPVFWYKGMSSGTDPPNSIVYLADNVDLTRGQCLQFLGFCEDHCQKKDFFGVNVSCSLGLLTSTGAVH